MKSLIYGIIAPPGATFQINVRPHYVGFLERPRLSYVSVCVPNPIFSEKLLPQLLWSERTPKMNVWPSRAGHLFFDRFEKFVFKKKLVRKFRKFSSKFSDFRFRKFRISKFSDFEKFRNFQISDSKIFRFKKFQISEFLKIFKSISPKVLTILSVSFRFTHLGAPPAPAGLVLV